MNQSVAQSNSLQSAQRQYQSITNYKQSSQPFVAQSYITESVLQSKIISSNNSNGKDYKSSQLNNNVSSKPYVHTQSSDNSKKQINTQPKSSSNQNPKPVPYSIVQQSQNYSSQTQQKNDVRGYLFSQEPYMMSEVVRAAAPLADKTNFYNNNAVYSSKETKQSTNQTKNSSAIGQSVSSKMQSHYSSQNSKDQFKNSGKESNNLLSALQNSQGQGQGGGSDFKHAFEIQNYLSNQDLDTKNYSSITQDATKKTKQYTKENNVLNKSQFSYKAPKTKPKSSLQAHMQVSINSQSALMRNHQLLERPNTSHTQSKLSTSITQSKAPSTSKQSRPQSRQPAIFYSKQDMVQNLNSSTLSKVISAGQAPNTTKASRKSALNSHNVSTTSLKQKTPNKNMIQPDRRHSQIEDQTKISLGGKSLLSQSRLQSIQLCADISTIQDMSQPSLMSPADHSKNRLDIIQNAINRDKRNELIHLYQEIIKGLHNKSDQKGLIMIFEHLLLQKSSQNDQKSLIIELKQEVEDLQRKVKVGQQMYEEVRAQRQTIRELEKQISQLKIYTSKDDSRRERCFSVQQIERSASPLINVPKLDLTKIKPFDQKQAKPTTQLKTTSLIQENQIPDRQLQTIKYEQKNNLELIKQQKALSPNNVISKLNERSFGNQQSHHGLHHSNSNGQMTLLSKELMDLDSNFNYRKLNAEALSVQSDSRSNQEYDTEQRRKRSNPPVSIPLLDLSRLSIKNDVHQPKKKSVEGKSIEQWKLDISKLSQPSNQLFHPQQQLALPSQNESWRKYSKAELINPSKQQRLTLN